MNESNITLYFILACIFVILIFIFYKPIKLFIKFFIQSSFCLFIIFILNFIVSPNIYIGINYLNAIFLGILGIPGLISLYIIRFIL